MKRLLPALAAGLILLHSQAAKAQVASAVPEDPGGAIVEELVVQAKEPGPAWWVVSDGDSTVYILGMPGYDLPKSMKWDRRYVDRRLKGANSLVLADTLTIKVGFSSFREGYRIYRSQRSDQPLEERLEEPLRSRFAAARQKVGKPASRYSEWSVFMASILLVADAEPRGLVSPRDEVILAARKARVRRVEAPAVNVGDIIRKLFTSMPPELERTCLAAAVRTVERGQSAGLADAWARGDVAASLDEPRDYEGCLLLLSGGAQIWRSAVGSYADMIANALKTPGHSVALVDISMLVAEEGVLRRLEARGFEVTGPGGS